MKKNMLLFFVGLVAFVSLYAGEIDCTECHDADGDPAINIEVFTNSVHGDMTCVDCHSNAVENFDDHPDNIKGAPDCSECHEEVIEAQSMSIHKNLTCANCHGDIHSIDPDTSIVGNGEAILNMCSRCHGEAVQSSNDSDKSSKACPNLDKVKKTENKKLVDHYTHSVHYLKKKDDGSPSASCADCHGSHDILKFDNKDSKIYKPNLSTTCGQCHVQEAKEYDASIHAEGVRKGWSESPSCTCCHNSHNIKVTDSDEALTSKLLVAEKLCLSCHEDERLIERYDLESHIGSTFRDSYHSMANAKGSQKAATCTDCHTTHFILKSSNENASTGTDHLLETCGKCHEGINERFAFSYTHKASLKEGNEINYYVKLIYIWLIIGTIGGMFLHNFIIYLHHVIVTYRKRKKMASVQRMTKGLVIMHMTLLISFFVLVITGFSLRLSHLDFFYFIPFSMSEIVRAWIHRVAGIILSVLLMVHFARMIIGKADRGVMKKMLPVPKDIRDVIDNFKYHLFLSKKFPRFGQNTYIEKAEYLALIWGTIVMMITGFILWFPEISTMYLPGWAIKVAETIHFYEAILATLAIIVWHLFFVVMHPEVYPLDTTFLNGQMPVEEIQHMRPEWYDQLKESGNLPKDE